MMLELLIGMICIVLFCWKWRIFLPILIVLLVIVGIAIYDMRSKNVERWERSQEIAENHKAAIKARKVREEKLKKENDPYRMDRMIKKYLEVWNGHIFREPIYYTREWKKKIDNFQTIYPEKYHNKPVKIIGSVRKATIDDKGRGTIILEADNQFGPTITCRFPFSLVANDLIELMENGSNPYVTIQGIMVSKTDIDYCILYRPIYSWDKFWANYDPSWEKLSKELLEEEQDKNIFDEAEKLLE